MFKEATKNRPIIHAKQREAPMTFEEIFNCVKGRFRWNANEKKWNCAYRPYRDHWVFLLKTVSDRIFALAPEVPDVGPILSQFEQFDLKQQEKTMGKTSNLGGTSKLYSSIKYPRDPQFQGDKQKPEAGVKPEGKIAVIGEAEQPKGTVQSGTNPYDQAVNARISQPEEEFPKITFEAKEFYQYAEALSQSKQTWRNDSENPIFQFVPTQQVLRSVDNRSQFMSGQQSIRQDSQLHVGQTPRGGSITPYGQSDGEYRTGRSRDHDSRGGAQAQHQQKAQSANKLRKSNPAFATAAKTMVSPGGGGGPGYFATMNKSNKNNKDFTRTFKINDVNTDKQISAKGARTMVGEGGQVQTIPDEYSDPKDPKFRDDYVPFGKKDMNLRFKCPEAYNKWYIAENNKLPMEVQRKQLAIEDKEKAAQKEEYEKSIHGQKKSKDWRQYFHYHNLPEKLKPIAQDFSDTAVDPNKWPKEAQPFLEKEEYTPEVLQLARQLRDDVVFGKPNFNLYFKAMKPADLNEEFGGTKTKPFKVIY